MTSFSTAISGFDRGEPAAFGPGAKVDAKTWYKNLYNQSPFTVNSAYLTHSPTKAQDELWLSDKSGYPALKPQGWGWCIFTLGHQAQNGMLLPKSLDTNEKLREQAVTDARKIKDMAFTLDSDLAGSVVIYDNEDGVSLKSEKRIIPYYKAVFEEMRQPGGTPKTATAKAPALRVGFYSRPLQQPEMLAEFPDLFLWPCDLQIKWEEPIYKKVPVDPSKPNGKQKGILQAPFNEVGDNIEFFNDWFKVNLVTVPNGLSSIPLGKQALFWSEKKEKHYMPRKDLKGLPKVSDWDFDISFVRDPRYPQGEPSFVVQGNKILRGVFEKSSLSMKTNITIFDGNKAQAPVALAGEPLEPEAPLVFLPDGDIFSLGREGRLVGSKPTGNGAWGGFAALSSAPAQNAKAADEPRRMRALHVEPRGADAYLFYMSKEFQLVTRRRLGGRSGRWGDPTTMAPLKPKDGPHQLSGMAVTSSQRSIDVFYINTSGHLTVTSPLLSTSPIYPVQNSIVLERAAPSLLLGTALAAVSPSSDHILVFGISNELRLCMAAWQSKAGWTPLTPLGEPDKRVFAHSRLFAFCPPRNRSTVHIAAISNTNVPCVYTVQAQNGKWAFQQRREYPKAKEEPPASGHDPNPDGPLGEAFSYDVNPFGDVGLFEDGQGLVLAVTGVSFKAGAVLLTHVGNQSDWQRIK